MCTSTQMLRIVVPIITVLVISVNQSASIQCNLCGNSTLPADSLQREKNGISCRSLFDRLVDLKDGSDDCRNVQLTSFQTGCCDEAILPEICSICPDNAPYRTGTSVPATEGRSELMCADLQGEASFLDFLVTPGDCNDTFLRRSAGWCGCAGQQIHCPLCPDGSRPPDPTKTESVLYGWDCSVFEYVLALLSVSECSVASEILEFDAAAFCCPQVAAPPDLCSFCPEGQVVNDPETIIASGYGPLKCGDIDDSVRFIPTSESCDFTRQKFDTSLCCGYGFKSSAGSEGLFYWGLANAVILFFGLQIL